MLLKPIYLDTNPVVLKHQRYYVPLTVEAPRQSGWQQTQLASLNNKPPSTHADALCRPQIPSRPKETEATFNNKMNLNNELKCWIGTRSIQTKIALTLLLYRYHDGHAMSRARERY